MRQGEPIPSACQNLKPETKKHDKKTTFRFTYFNFF